MSENVLCKMLVLDSVLRKDFSPYTEHCLHLDISTHKDLVCGEPLSVQLEHAESWVNLGSGNAPAP